jgi:hypothetical protein
MANIKVGNIKGPLGPPGVPACTVTSADFVVPPVGQTQAVDVDEASWVVVGQNLTVETAGGSPAQAGTLQVTAKNGNQLTLLNPQPSTGIPLASPATDGLLRMVSGNVGDFVDGTNACRDLASAVEPVIWNVRQRSYSSVGNPGMEVDQKLCNGASSTTTGFGIDRWKVWQTGTMVISRWQSGIAGGPLGGDVIPNAPRTGLTSKMLRLRLDGQQSSLGADDNLDIQQNVEGVRFRELAKDVHSLSLVAAGPQGFKFAVTLFAGGQSLTKLCTIGSGGYTYIPLPNLPKWPSGLSMEAGVAAYNINVCLAAGSNKIVSATDVWVPNSNGAVGALGMDNFASLPLNTVFDLVFLQHEPGPACGYFIDCPFEDNLESCLRYYQKSYQYKTPAGTGSLNFGATLNALTAGWGWVGSTWPFVKRMAKSPTVYIYNPTTGAVNSAKGNSGTNYAISGPGSTDSHIVGFTLSPSSVGPDLIGYHYTADTGW